MKNRKTALALLIATITFLFAPLAHATDIPLLTWERGKQQNIVLGGSSTNSGWKIFMVAPGQSDREFTSSLPNKAGFVVYSIELPNTLPLGGYSIEARTNGSSKSTVAAVNVIARSYYTISSIPTDLRLLFILYALIISTFAVIRVRRYSRLSFTRDKSHHRAKSDEQSKDRLSVVIKPFYGFRIRRQIEVERSFLKFISYKDGEPLHRLSPSVWAVTPFIAFLVGIYMSYSIQSTTIVPNVALPLIILVVVVGAVDALSGASAAVGFVFASFILGDITGMRSFLAVVSFVMAWCVPSMLASLYLLLLKVDLKVNFPKLSDKAMQLLALFLSALFGSTIIIISAVLTDSLVINFQGNSFLRWPLALITLIVIFAKNFAEDLIQKYRTRREIEVETFEEVITLSQVMSTGITFIVMTAIFGVTYVWSEKMAQSFFATIVISTPFFLNTLAFPENIARRFKLMKRNLLLEIIAISGLTALVYQAIQHLPMSTREKAQAFILIGLVPLLLHSLYSAISVSSENVNIEEEEEKV